MISKTFEQIAKDPVSTVYEDFVEEGIRCRIMRGPCGMVAYLGISPSHPIAGKEYDDIPLDVHGGLTFSRAGDGKNWPKGYWWYGWDYAHAGDKAFYDLERPWASAWKDNYHEWTVPEVHVDVIVAAWNMKKLMNLYTSPVRRFLRWVKARLP